MTTMQQIEQKAMKLAAVRDALAGTHMAHEEEAAALLKKYRPRLLKLTAEFKAAADELQQAVAQAPALFVKPRSVILHGIKAGYQKGKGKLSWEDDEQLCKLIRKQQPDLVEVLIKVTETPVKAALNELPAADLRKLGIEVEDTGDVPFVKLADTEIAKTIKALLKDKGDEA
jgi:hypothetical protein